MSPSLYSFELWTPEGLLLADLSGRASGRHVTITRNDSEDIQWKLDLNELKRYAKSIGTNYQALVQPGVTEVRVRRGTKYLCGGQVTYVSKDRSAQGDSLDIRARGFLDLFDYRLTPSLRTYTNVDRAAIIADLVTWTQSQGPDWDFGVTMGSVPTTAPYSFQLQNQKIKNVIEDISKLLIGVDFAFTPDKVLNLYRTIGSRRPDVIFSYPGNIKRLTGVSDATRIQNQIYMLGSGIGDTAAVAITIDSAYSDALASQRRYKVRESTIQLSDKLDSGTLQDFGLTQLASWGVGFDLPAIEYDGAVGPAITDFGIGDYVVLEEADDPDTDLNGFWRVEKIDLSLDDNDTEDVKLTVSR